MHNNNIKNRIQSTKTATCFDAKASSSGISSIHLVEPLLSVGLKVFRELQIQKGKSTNTLILLFHCRR